MVLSLVVSVQMSSKYHTLFRFFPFNHTIPTTTDSKVPQPPTNQCRLSTLPLNRLAHTQAIIRLQRIHPWPPYTLKAVPPLYSYNFCNPKWNVVPLLTTTAVVCIHVPMPLNYFHLYCLRIIAPVYMYPLLLIRSCYGGMANLIEIAKCISVFGKDGISWRCKVCLVHVADTIPTSWDDHLSCVRCRILSGCLSTRLQDWMVRYILHIGNKNLMQFKRLPNFQFLRCW